MKNYVFCDRVWSLRYINYRIVRFYFISLETDLFLSCVNRNLEVSVQVNSDVGRIINEQSTLSAIPIVLWNLELYYYDIRFEIRTLLIKNRAVEQQIFSFSQNGANPPSNSANPPHSGLGRQTLFLILSVYFSLNVYVLYLLSLVNAILHHKPRRTGVDVCILIVLHIYVLASKYKENFKLKKKIIITILYRHTFPRVKQRNNNYYNIITRRRRVPTF